MDWNDQPAHVLLIRTDRIPDGVFGKVHVNGVHTLATCEDDWKDNIPGESCIPAGDYIMRRAWYRKGGYETFEILDAPGNPPVLDKRDPILFHRGNTEEDVKGCVAVGMRRGRLRVVRDEDTGARNVVKESVAESEKAFHKFMEAMEGVDEATLTVRWAPGLP